MSDENFSMRGRLQRGMERGTMNNGGLKTQIPRESFEDLLSINQTVPGTSTLVECALIGYTVFPYNSMLCV